MDFHIPMSVRAMLSAANPFVVLGSDLNSQQIPHNARAYHLRGRSYIYWPTLYNFFLSLFLSYFDLFVCLFIYTFTLLSVSLQNPRTRSCHSVPVSYLCLHGLTSCLEDYFSSPGAPFWGTCSKRPPRSQHTFSKELAPSSSSLPSSLSTTQCVFFFILLCS